jgi:hypothetical protein
MSSNLFSGPWADCRKDVFSTPCDRTLLGVDIGFSHRAYSHTSPYSKTGCGARSPASACNGTECMTTYVSKYMRTVRPARPLYVSGLLCGQNLSLPLFD